MTEHRVDATPGPDPYWQHDVAIDVPPSYDLTGGFGFRFKIDEATERYGRSHEDLVVQLTGPGTRLYFHGKPYRPSACEAAPKCKVVPDHLALREP
jgi:hypothetical protein